MGRGSLVRLSTAFAVPLPALFLRLAGVELRPTYAALVYGAAVVGAAVLLAWAAEVAQLDISGSLAIAILALIAVLPEYAVDLYFAYTAGHDPTFAQYAAANMTGSNRLLIGLGWPLLAVAAGLGLRKLRRSQRVASTAGAPTPEVEPACATTPAPAFAHASARRAPAITLKPKRRIELFFLAVASVYAFVIPITGRIGLVSSAILLLLYVAYLWRVAKEERSEPELIGICSEIGSLSCRRRRSLVIGMTAAAAAFILAAAEPFANALVATGAQLGIDEFLLVQWLAPLVSESPELIVAGLLAYRLKGDDAMGTLLSSKVNQWTLLVGTIPLAYLLGGGGTGGLALDARQTGEFLLTAAQAVLGLAILANLRFGGWKAGALFALFALQFPFPQASVRIGFSIAYGALALVLLVLYRRSLWPVGKYVFGVKKEAARMEQFDTQRPEEVDDAVSGV
jgi:cation:H+ antiporter